MQPFISIIFFSKHTYILKCTSFFFIFKCRLVFKLPLGEISIPHKPVGFSEISPPQSLLPSCMLILNLLLNNLFFILLVIYSVWQNNKINTINQGLKEVHIDRISYAPPLKDSQRLLPAFGWSRSPRSFALHAAA